MHIFLYNFLLILLSIIFSPLLVAIVFGSKKYRNIFKKRLYERFYSLDHCKNGTRIWVHALSVGEVFSAEPLVRKIASKWGKLSIVFTVSTQPGYVVAQKYIKPHVSNVNYFPYDILWFLTDIIDIIRPTKVVFVETDLWPNLLFLLKKRGVATYLVNAKISNKLHENFNIFKGLANRLFSLLTGICVQSTSDEELFLKLGVNKEKIFLSGNIKFDQNQVVLSAKLLEKFRMKLGLYFNRPVFIAGSTHGGEECIIATVFKRLASFEIMPILLIAPRDPTRASEVCGIFNSIGSELVIEKFSDLIDAAPTPMRGKVNVDVIVVDRIGVLKSLYALSDVAFVGGSMVDRGGHNVLEPAFVGKPVLFGPYMGDFKHVAAMLEKFGGGIRVSSEEELLKEVVLLLSDPTKAKIIGYKAYKFSDMHKGAVEKTLKFIDLGS